MKPKLQEKTILSLAAAVAASLVLAVPVHAAVDVANSSSTVSGGADLTVSSTDLVNQGQLTFLGPYSESGSPTFGAGTVNEGTATNDINSGAFYRTTQLPTTLVFNLDVTTNTLGYDITRIDSLAGWQGGGTQTYANQNFTVEYSVVGSAAFTSLTAVDYSPFTSTTSGNPAYTQSTITEDSTGVLASGVDALRFVYSDPTISGGTNRGTVLQEIDIAGVPTSTSTIKLIITPNPTSPGNYDFQWNSKAGKSYDLVSDTGLATTPADWSVWRGNSDIPSGGMTTSLINIPAGADTGRFFAVLEKTPSPPPE